MRLKNTLQVEMLDERVNPTLVVDAAAYDSSHILVKLADSNTIAQTPLSDSAESLGFGIYRIDLVPGVSPEAALRAYRGMPNVEFAELDYMVHVDLTTNDPSFGSQWALQQANDKDIDAPEGWNHARGTGQTVVAVIDSGVNYNHPDLNANMWHNPGETAGNGLDDDNNGRIDDIYGYDFANNDSNPMDDNSHGTHVAGTIGAVGNNGIGVSGVAWTTRIMALKFIGANGSGSTSHAIQAINYAVAQGAKILNNSWGGGGNSNSLSNAINGARQAGVIFVAAAGNSGSNNNTSPTYPANYTTTLNNVVSVAATTSSDSLASYSNYGSTTVTLGAPGSDILSTSGNGYSYKSGTSMATPHVSGALAVLWDQNPTWTYQQVLTRLNSTVDQIPALAGKTITGGRLNLGKLVVNTQGPRVNSVEFSGTVASSFNRARLTFSEVLNSSSFTVADVISLTGPNGAITPTSITAVNSIQFDVNFPTQTTLGTYSITVGPNILDEGGQSMDQNQNGILGEVPGDQFTGTGVLVLNTVDYVGTNTTTQGSWRGILGVAGYTIAQSGTSLPAGVSVAVTGQNDFTWAASTQNVRALQKPNPATDRIAACWYSGSFFDIAVNVTGDQAKRVSLYFLDWDSAGRVERVDVINSVGSIVDVKTVSSFANGKYLIWDISGQVTFRITKTSGVNAVLSGIFFDNITVPVDTGGRVTGSIFSGNSSSDFNKVRLTFNEPIVASSFTTADVTTLTGPNGNITPTSVVAVSGSNNTQFDINFASQLTLGAYSVTVGPNILDVTGNAMDQNQNGVNGEATDTYTGSATLSPIVFIGTNVTTQGSWQGALGANGHQIAQNASSIPSYATIAMTGQTGFTWASSTQNVRALQKSSPATDRIASCWYANNSFNVAVTAEVRTRISFYCLDWDNLGRSQRIDVLDANGNVVNSQTVSSFSGGKYLTWEISGSVTFRITKLSGVNAVLSGIFFDTV